MAATAATNALQQVLFFIPYLWSMLEKFYVGARIAADPL
jgi:hypothetical protein